eukprot:scaffold2357_cov167-Amphora_coffeaeformis.AAC.19
MLSDTGRSRYLNLEKEDRERYRIESEAADAEAAARVEERQRALEVQEGEGHSSRGARQRIDAERAAKEAERERRRQEREANMDPEELEERRREKERLKAEVEERRRAKQEEENALAKQHKKLDKEQSKKAAQRLEYLLKQSSIFSKLQGADGHTLAEASNSSSADRRKRGAAHIHEDKSNAGSDEAEEEDDGEEHIFLTQQPSCIKHGQLKPYQLESLNWMIHLSEKGLNGILADEMGLGKTLQSISILAYHYEFRQIQGPHLICVPKSSTYRREISHCVIYIFASFSTDFCHNTTALSNWMNELKRWCPALRAIKFHGSREEREYMIDTFFTSQAASHDGKRPERQIMGEGGELVDDNSENPRGWDVCVTTYEVANNEKRTLGKFAWKYLIIDEAHRLKNDVSMFSQTVRSFKTSNRLLLTGTPLQNNLHELWALLNFLLPDIFSSAEQFDEWFDLDIDDEEAKKNMISQLHKILRPFMLRRLKADVAKGLPPKTETILMVGMSKMQKQLYKKLLLRDLDSITSKVTGKNRTAVLNIVMQLRKCCGHPYLFEGVEDRTLDPLGEHLVDNCGKLNMVDKLLKRLKERGHRVLIFTQMTRVLDILEDYMVMRGYKYCRIDGNTTYDDRESSIDNFNSPGSDIFCFILSTRAGGLGINLQTADTCILYDSDWNPQQDLQAQDRCHRLGQKKPVQVFRLVSENTVEEKIVERAQQKLKLDAMVVQQGRLKDKDKVSKEELMAAVRFGADAVFKSEDSTISNEDIDAILERGAAKTKELTEKIQKRDKGDLLDFRLDGGISAQTFEGVDYSDRDLRDHLRMMAADSMGKRERRPPPMSYNPVISTKKTMIVKGKNIKLPKCLRIPQMEDHQFYNRERLLELGKLEFETYAALREANELPPREVMESKRSLLPPDLAQEKLELIAEGFEDWSRSQYYHFVKACAKFGRDDIASIAADMDMPEEAIQPYSDAFWKYGPTELKKEWERVSGSIERGEKKIAKQKKLTQLLTKFVSTFDNPREEMVFANKGTTYFALEQDRALLCAVEKHGYGNWDLVREEIRTDPKLRFQHSVQGMSVQAIAKRCDYRMRQMEKELEAREKVLKSRRPANVIAAYKATEAIKEAEFWELRAREALLRGEGLPDMGLQSAETKITIEERRKDVEGAVARLREIEVQNQMALRVAEETRQSIFDGAQYVNYSNITLKPPPSAAKDENGASLLKQAIAIEARVNMAVLKIPPCRECAACTSADGRLCERRLEVRRKLVSSEEKRPHAIKEKKKAPKRKHEPSPKKPAQVPVKSAVSVKKKKLMVRPDGQLKVRVTSQGNKRMSIPDELFPEFCCRIGANGNASRTGLVNEFVDENPTISARQVTLRLNEITTKDRPPCVPEAPPEKKKGPKFMFYLRPCFYKYLQEDQRPDGWEEYATADQILYDKEQWDKKNDPKTSKSTASSGGASPTSSRMSVEGNGDADGDETEEEDAASEPPAKKARLDN